MQLNQHPLGFDVPVRVLVVDDDRDNAEVLSGLLSRMGHETIALFHATSVLEAVPSFKPEIMMIDLAMPAIDGYELARRLRGGTIETDAALVAVSGYADAAHRQQAVEAGFDHFLVKPYTMLELRQLLSEFESLRERAQETRRQSRELYERSFEASAQSHDLAERAIASNVEALELARRSQELIDRVRAVRDGLDSPPPTSGPAT